MGGIVDARCHRREIGAVEGVEEGVVARKEHRLQPIDPRSAREAAVPQAATDGIATGLETDLGTGLHGIQIARHQLQGSTQGTEGAAAVGARGSGPTSIAIARRRAIETAEQGIVVDAACLILATATATATAIEIEIETEIETGTGIVTEIMRGIGIGIGIGVAILETETESATAETAITGATVAEVVATEGGAAGEAMTGRETGRPLRTASGAATLQTFRQWPISAPSVPFRPPRPPRTPQWSCCSAPMPCPTH